MTCAHTENRCVKLRIDLFACLILRSLAFDSKLLQTQRTNNSLFGLLSNYEDDFEDDALVFNNNQQASNNTNSNQLTSNGANNGNSPNSLTQQNGIF